jgi:ectoine hydroxylase
MDSRWLEHRLTPAERATFDENGFLLLEGLLTPEETGALAAAATEVYGEARERVPDPDAALCYPNFLPRNPAFVELVDHPKVFPKIWGILGWNIYLYHTHLSVAPPCAGGAAQRWSQDGGRVNAEIECRPRPRLSVKVAYFLSDATEPDRGNFWLLPGSHLCDEITAPPDGRGHPEGAIPVLARPGTALIYDRRLWHANACNRSEVTRLMLYYGYGYRWLRAKDAMTVAYLWDRDHPIRRQLLGWSQTPNGFYEPTPADAPLREWIRIHCPEDLR